jgi:hyperosmotically inducible periplasmic protein
MNAKHPLVLMFAATMFLGACVAVRGSDMDKTIEASARKTYVYRTYLKDDNIGIESKDGTVTLTGTVAEESHKTLAQATVEELPGVKRVENRLEVDGEKAEENSDRWIGTKIKTSLWFHRSVSSQTDVDVKDGVVTLNGTASSQAQKDLTAEYATDVEGVRSVNNEMTVILDGSTKDEETAAELIDDASITAQVKLSLATHRSTSALRTGTETRDGVVTLTGEAANQAEKDLVSKLTRDINGVKGVNNNMTLKA